MTEPAARRPAVRTVAYGRPATEALAGAIAAAKQGHPLDPVTVVVASNLAGLSVRRLIGGGTVGAGGLANVSFLTPLRLAELLAVDALPGHPLPNAALAAATRVVLRRRPEPFGRVADHHASEAAVVALYAELSRLRPETLQRLAARDERAAALVRLHEAVRAELRPHYYDEDDRARAATARVRSDPSAARNTLGSLVWFLPDRLSPALAELVGAALAVVPSLVVVGGTGAATADAAVLRTCRTAGVPVEVDAVTRPTGNRVVSVSDPDEEVRAVCREVLALAEAGTPFDRIGVFFPSPDPYARTLHEQLEAAGVPHNGPSRLRLADGVAGRTLLGALALPDHDWSRAAVVAVANDGPVRHRGDTVPTAAWDDLSREAGVVAGRADWATKLEALATDREAVIRERRDDPEATEWYVEELHDDAHRARDLAAWVAALADAVDAVDRAAGWSGKVAAARDLLVHLLGSEGRRTSWPETERVAAERVDAALARLALLDDLDPSPGTTTFTRAIEAELDEPAGRIGRFGEGVLFGPTAMAPGLDLDAVFVLGMAEGTCPRPRGEDALLPDEDRAASGGELLGRDDGLHQQHRHLLAALATGRSHRVLTFPRGDLRGTRTRLPSRWLLDTAGALHGGTVHSGDFDRLPPEVVHEVRSFNEGLLRAPTPAGLVERDLAVLEAHRLSGGWPGDHPTADDALRRGLTALHARSGPAFTEWDGNLAGLAVPSPSGGKPLSATAMQTWAECPYRYFLGQVLRLVERPEPETTTTIAATDRGTLLHRIVERFLAEVLERPKGPPAPTEAWTVADRERLHALAAEEFALCEAAGVTGRALLWRLQQRLLLDDLDHFLADDEDQRAAFGSRPAAVELAFGLEGAEPLRLDLGGGRVLHFRGRIDRVDTTTDGRHVIYDYKTGKGKGYRELRDDPVRAGKTLQLGLYAEAVAQQRGGEEVASYFWMLTQDGDYRRYGSWWSPEHRARFLDVLGAITDGIEAGVFPARSGAFDPHFRNHANCGFCDFDRVCDRDRDEHEQAKAGAPELAVLQRLLPPEPEADATAPVDGGER